MLTEGSDRGGEQVERVMVVDDDPIQCHLLRSWLERDGYEVEVFADGESCLRGLMGLLPDAICLDMNLPGMSGSETLSRILEHHPRMPILILTANAEVEQAVAAIQAGAFNYLTKPVDRAHLVTTLRSAVRHGRLMVRLAQLENELEGWEATGMLGESAPMRALFREMERVAQTDVTVLIHGESGTGKELVARGIHHLGPRRAAPLLTLNCATIPESLQESELFGHEKGAFTGATSMRSGLFERANGGTVFLDEVGELSASAQTKLLRVVQQGTFQRVGGDRQLSSDFRLLAATHRDLAEDVATGRFREDLYFRLAVFELEVPPLNERGDDVVILAGHFARVQGERLVGRPVQLSPEAVALVRRYDWPGNVRELENAIQRAVVASANELLTPADFPSRIRRVQGATSSRSEGTATLATPSAAVAGDSQPERPAPVLGTEGTLEGLERAAILDALHRTRGNVAEACRLLGIGRTTMYAKMKKYGVR